MHIKKVSKILLDKSDSEKVRNMKKEALKILHKQIIEYSSFHFEPFLIKAIAEKKAAFISSATTRKELEEILKSPPPHFNGNKYVASSIFSVDEEELIQWSQASLIAPLNSAANNRFKELFQKCFGIDPNEL